MGITRAKQYQEYLASAKEAADKRLAMLREENLIYNGIMPFYDTYSSSAWTDDDYTARTPTQSKYLSPDYPLTVDTYAESMIYNFPSFDFEANDRQFSKDEIDVLNRIFTRIAFANNLSFKMMSVIRTGIRKAFCACELVPSEITVNRQIKVNGDWVDDKVTTYTGVLDLIRYLPSQTFIDPNADPDDIRNTAEYCIAYLGFYSLATYKAMAEKKGWSTDDRIKEINATTLTDEGGEEQEKNAEGIQRGQGVKVSKLFLMDGSVQVVVNDEWIVWEGINAKRIRRMPLIFYKALPGGATPYGRLLWQTMRPSVMALSAATNLVLDNIGKNLAGPTYHTLKELDGKNINDYENGALIYVGKTADPTRKLEDQVARIEVPDMTVGAQFALGKFSTDVSRISKLDTLSQGSQGPQQVRTDSIAEKLSQPSITQKSAFVKQAEFSFFQEFGRDMLSILYAFYDDFSDIKAIPREKLADIRAVRVRQGSTLEEDSRSKVEKIGEMVRVLLATNEDSFSIDKALTDYFISIGIADPEWYKLPINEQLMKAYLKGGMDPVMAQAETQRVMTMMDEARNARTKTQ